MGRIEEDRRKLNELRTSNEILRNMREAVQMKRPDEDLFIIVTPGEERKIRVNGRYQNSEAR
jgi:hypothetical protein